MINNIRYLIAFLMSTMVSSISIPLNLKITGYIYFVIMATFMFNYLFMFINLCEYGTLQISTCEWILLSIYTLGWSLRLSTYLSNITYFAYLGTAQQHLNYYIYIY